MRVKVEFVVDVSDDIRRAINVWYGRPGLASRAEIKRWYESNGRSMDEDLSWSADQLEERG